MASELAVAAHWSSPFEEAALQQWAEQLRKRLPAPHISLGLVFMAPRYFKHARQILEILRVHARIPILAGCSSQSLIVEAEEIEDHAGLTVGVYALPGA